MQLFKGTINYSRKVPFWANLGFFYLCTYWHFIQESLLEPGTCSPLLSKGLKFDSALCLFMKLTFITFKPCLICFISKIIHPSPHPLLLTGSGLWAHCRIHQAFPCFRGNSKHIPPLYKTWGSLTLKTIFILPPRDHLVSFYIPCSLGT